MPVPTHGPNCRTKMYPTKCWGCKNPIHIFQCSCGSAILLNAPYYPWDRHFCGAWSGGWKSTSSLNNSGLNVPVGVVNVAPPGQNTARVEPEGGEATQIIGVLRNLDSRTKHMEGIYELPEDSIETLGLPQCMENCTQATLVVTEDGESSKFSYKCLANTSLLRDLKKDTMVVAELEPRVDDRGYAIWLIKSIETLGE